MDAATFSKYKQAGMEGTLERPLLGTMPRDTLEL